MKKQKTNEMLNFRFHNPNTVEETVKHLIPIVAQVAKVQVTARLLALEEPPQEPPQEELLEENASVMGLQMG